MKNVKIDLSKDLKDIDIYVFSDEHVGDPHANINYLKERIEYVKSHPNAYAILNGDLMDNATKTSVSDCYAEAIPPMQQLQTLCELLEPIKDKILMITQGNHEARTYRNDGIDLTALMAKQLGIYDKYAREGGVLFLRFGEHLRTHRKMCYTFYVTHGSGGGKKEGGKANGLCDLASIVDTDVYLHSHVHLPMVIKENFFRIDTANSFVAETEKLFVNTAASLEYGGYGQQFKFKPANSTSPIIHLDGHKKKFSATL